MHIDELNLLFEKYLKRKPNDEDIKEHIEKSYPSFEKEISICDEALYRSKKLKIAFLVSGHYRKGNIVDFLNKHDQIDVFVSSWDDFGIRGSEQNLNLSNKLEVEKKIKTIKNIKKLEILNNKEFVLKNNDQSIKYYNYSSPEIFIKSQLFSINSSFNLLKEYCADTGDYYDIVFKCRFDTSFSKFNISNLTANNIENNKIIFVTNDNCHQHLDFPNGCYICNKMYYEKKMSKVHISEHSNIVCDFFAYGSFKSMEKYCNLYHHYDNINTKLYIKNEESEKMNKIHFEENGNSKKVSHDDSLYYIYCSYPERMLQIYLNDHMLVSSKDILVDFHP